MGDRLSPFVLQPRETAAIWGGDALVRRYGKQGDLNATLGESWECWDANGVRGGPFNGKTLAELRAELGHRLTGPIDPAVPFPVLTKIIDARLPLSVQVHPDDAYAQRVEGEPNGKTECWYVLASEPGAELVLGWTRDTTRAEYERRVADGTLGEILRRVPVHAGDVYYLPAGTLHAIGGGIQVFETQQTSDLTYRIFDWNRTGPDGKPRELHVAKAADVLDYRAGTQGALARLELRGEALVTSLLVAEPRFAVERVDVAALDGILPSDGRPLALTAMDAHLRIDTDGGSVVLAPWETALTPASAEQVVLVPGGTPTSALVVRPCPDLAALRARFAKAAADEDAADRFFAQFSSVQQPAVS